MTPHIALLVLFADTSNRNKSQTQDIEQSRWMRRTAKRRQRADDLLNSIEAGGQELPIKLGGVSVVPTLQIPQSLKWEDFDPLLDPMRGGKIRMSDRGLRKRAQVDAFHCVLSSFVESTLVHPEESKGITIIDAGCGAGNLAVALAGLFSPHSDHIEILAVDVNEHALQRLEERKQSISLPTAKLETCCADLADNDYIYSQISSDRSVIVVSLHACGAAADMAMNLAFRCNNAPFVICPCCTAKSLTKRKNTRNEDKQQQKNFDPAASFQRSGATTDIAYPRSGWLKSKLQTSTFSTSIEEQYTVLAKVADIGLGPQTPAQQRQTQSRAKKVIELDRLLSASENQGYDIRLMRLPDHDPLVYGKGDLLLGASSGSSEAGVLQTIFNNSCNS